MNVGIDAGDNHPLVAIMALPNPPEADPFLMSKNFSMRKIRCRGLRLGANTPEMTAKCALASDAFKMLKVCHS